MTVVSAQNARLFDDACPDNSYRRGNKYDIYAISLVP